MINKPIFFLFFLVFVSLGHWIVFTTSTQLEIIEINGSSKDHTRSRLRILSLEIRKIEKKVTSKKDNSSKKALKENTAILSNTNQVEAYKESFLRELRLLIERHKFYPALAKKLGQYGQVSISFNLSKNGEINNVKILGSSQYPILDEAAIKTINSIGRFKPIPAEMKISSLNLIQRISYEN